MLTRKPPSDSTQKSEMSNPWLWLCRRVRGGGSGGRSGRESDGAALAAPSNLLEANDLVPYFEWPGFSKYFTDYNACSF